MASAADTSPLEDLIARASLASQRMSIKNPHRALLKDMAIGLVAQAQLIADLQGELKKLRREESRIVLP